MLMDYYANKGALNTRGNSIFFTIVNILENKD